MLRVAKRLCLVLANILNSSLLAFTILLGVVNRGVGVIFFFIFVVLSCLTYYHCCYEIFENDEYNRDMYIIFNTFEIGLVGGTLGAVASSPLPVKDFYIVLVLAVEVYYACLILYLIACYKYTRRSRER